ncbi:class I SAM-dependent methyltransferase [Hyphococcus sp.]|uniref:class I SAM-dependent methyltransferase n=1 Tax=Hyphococcus sp. TaxID=2038636 RepID=UPI003CCBAD54
MHFFDKRILSATAVSLTLALGACGDGGGGEQTGAETEPEQTAAPADNGARLDAVLAGDHRTSEERARDEWRHPKETLLFFGLEPEMTVVEIAPGGGWYTQVIAPYLKTGGGKLYATGFPPDGASERALAANKTFTQTYVEQPEIYGDVELTYFGEGHHVAPEGAADMVLTFRNVHNWQSRGQAADAFAEFYRALKPGGVLGVVEHRADGAEIADDGSTGYVYTDDVIELATNAGFDLDMASEINANPADTKDHPFGVWTLPPVKRSSAIRGQDDPDFNRAPYDAIGESDRMTLKFRKPIAADGALLE